MSALTKNSALFVLGMHRSGTSALAGVLSMAGADPGPSLLPAMAEVNPKGFWEHKDIVAIHERLLDALNSSWDDERPLPAGWWRLQKVAVFRAELLAVLQRDFAASPLWLLKDPRQCRLLPLWLGILEELDIEPHFLICLRHPGEVAKSLERRDDIQAARANLLWLEHLVDSERWTRDLPRVAITYEQLLDDWRTVLQRIAVQLSLDLSCDDTTFARIDAFLEPSLRHHNSQAESAEEGRECALARAAYVLVAGEGLDSTIARFEEIRAEAAEIVERTAPWSAEICTLRKRYAILDKQHSATNADLQAEIARVKKSFSWRITKPLRAFWNLANKLFHLRPRVNRSA